MKYNKSCIVILEYGIPHYRNFLFDYFSRSFNFFKIIHSGERFLENEKQYTVKGKNLFSFGEFSVVFFNPLQLLKADVIVSTFNIYKPHTWIWVLLMPWKKWILWGQGIGNSKSKILILFRKLIIGISDGYVVYTEQGKEKLLQNGINSAKITIAGNTLQINNHQLTQGCEYFLYVGRLQERKGLTKAIKACISLNLKLIIVGDGIIKSKLEKQYSESENIIFRKAIYDEKILKNIFKDALAYVSPDHVGLGVVHAFAYGVPVLTNKNKGHAPEFAYCSDKNSYLYSEDEDLKKMLQEIFEDNKKRREKGKEAYSFYVNNLSSASMIKSFDEHFNKLFHETDYSRP